MTVRVDTCAGCSREFEQELVQGRPRTFCETCRPPVARVRKDRPLRKVPEDPPPFTVLQPVSAPIFPGLKPDPPVREDGRCALGSCRKPRRLTKVARRYAGVQLDLDPFCSSPCCRRFHGCSVAGDDGEFEKQASAGRARNEERKIEAELAA